MSDTTAFGPASRVVADTSNRPTWLIRHKWLVLSFLTLLFMSSAVRLLTFDRYLPVLDYSDESVRLVVAQERRGMVTNDWLEWRYAGHPPGYLWVNILVQQAVETFSPNPWVVPPDYFHALRLLAAFVGVVTVFVIASIGWQLAGPLAGWLSGFVWALSPVIVEHNSLAIPDPFVYLFCALALTSALRAWYSGSIWWLTGSLVAAIMAIYFKLWPVHTLLPWAVVLLLLLYRQRRQMLPWLFIFALMGLVTAAYLFLEVNPLEQLRSREVGTFNTEGLDFLLTPSRNLINWSFAIYPIGMSLFVLTMAAGAVAYFFNRRRNARTPSPVWIGILLLYSVAGIAIASSFTQVRLEVGKIRHVLPVTVALIPLWAAALCQVIWAVQRFLRDRSPYIAPVVGLLVVGVFTLPVYVPGNVELVQRFARPHLKSIFWTWTDNNIPLEGLILGHENGDSSHTWNREWSGYDGRKPFEWWLESEAQILASTPESYIERNIDYFVIDDKTIGEQFDRAELDDWLEQLVLVKSFPASPDIAGPAVRFYRMAPPEFPAQILFGGQIALTGYDLDISADRQVTFRPYWRTQRLPENNYSIFVHVIRAGEEAIITQHDGPPTTLERPTLTWDDTNELYIGSDIVLQLPHDAALGEYRMLVGLYDFNTGQRLLTDTGEDAFVIPIDSAEGR